MTMRNHAKRTFVVSLTGAFVAFSPIAVLGFSPEYRDFRLETRLFKDNRAMAFLRSKGKVGGNKDFTHAIGIDEGPSTKSNGTGKLKKAKASFQSCAVTGILDDLTEEFPFTSTGTEWSGYTDQVMGGVSVGHLCREEFDGRTANVMRGKVSLQNNGGFIQMATNLALVTGSDARPQVDASRFRGVELEVQYRGEEQEESFNVHLKTAACSMPYNSYRASFSAPKDEWKTVQIPWESFQGHGSEISEVAFDTHALTRAGIVAIGKEMDVCLAVSGVRFFEHCSQEKR